MEPINPYCQALGIGVPSLELAARSPDTRGLASNWLTRCGGDSERSLLLVDERDYEIFQADVQAARIAETGQGLR